MTEQDLTCPVKAESRRRGFRGDARGWLVLGLLALVALGFDVRAQGWTATTQAAPEATPASAESQARARVASASMPGVPAEFAAKYPPGSQQRKFLDLQLAFDHSADTFQELYQREQREHGGMEGTVHVLLALRWDGRVAAIEIVRSELPEVFTKELCKLIKAMKFGVVEGTGFYDTPYKFSFYPPGGKSAALPGLPSK